MSDQIYFDWIEFLNWKENCQPGSICFGATSIKGIQRRRKNNWRQTNEDVNSINWLIISLVAGKRKLDVFSTPVLSNFSQKV